mgnify:CR=1 FL=1
MKEAYQMTERLIAEFTANYMEKIFYFCLKRTGSSDEAGDLSSDIALNILSALDKGLVPEHFSAWVWQIARNRYSVWADRKHRQQKSSAGADISDYDIVCNLPSAEENLIHREELALLRRELAFISSDYRDIVVAYYIEDRKIQDIADSRNLSVGTVKSKLFRARKKLKEGMNMAREFGAKSFKPEEVTFAASGDQSNGLPWKVLDRKLPKNILLEASNNPSTIEELAVELGIAIPYMEEEVALLTDATLLRKTGDKYVTDFFILDKDTQLATYKIQRQSSMERSKLLDAIASDSLGQLRDLGIVRNGMSDNDLKWWAVIYLVNDCIQQAGAIGDGQLRPRRPNGEHWGITGYEQVDIPETCLMNHNGSGQGQNILWRYTPGDYGLLGRDEVIYNMEVLFLADIIKNNRNLSSFSASEQRQWRALENRFAHADEDGNIIPDILVIYRDDLERILELWHSHPLYAEAREITARTFNKITDIIRKTATTNLYGQLSYCASIQMMGSRMMTVHDEVNCGKLMPPEDPAHSKIGMYLTLARD